MKKVRDGKSGEITAEIFETWFPDKPEVILMDFLKTSQPNIFCVVKLGEDEFGVTNISREYAQKLLDEFRVIRGSK